MPHRIRILLVTRHSSYYCQTAIKPKNGLNNQQKRNPIAIQIPVTVSTRRRCSLRNSSHARIGRLYTMGCHSSACFSWPCSSAHNARVSPQPGHG